MLGIVTSRRVIAGIGKRIPRTVHDPIPGSAISSIQLRNGIARKVEVDIEHLLKDILFYMERVDLAPEVPVDISCILQPEIWALIFRSGVGPQLVTHTATCFDALLTHRWGEQVFDLAPIAADVFGKLEVNDILPAEAVNIARHLVLEQIDSEEVLCSCCVPGLELVEATTLMTTMQTIMVAFAVATARLQAGRL